MNIPLVSVIIPAYNIEKYIRESIDSALSQTYQNIEIIIVDDGSIDGTKKVIEPYIKNGKVKYIYQENKGLAGARNTGIKNSKGDFIALLDSDDIFLPQKIERQVKVLEDNPNFGICYCDLLHFTDRLASSFEASRAGTNPREFFHHRYQYPSGNLFKALLEKQFINPLTVVVRKSIFNKFGLFDERLRRSEDWELWLRFAYTGIGFYYLNEILAYYRIRNVGNLSSVDSEPEMKEKNLEIFLKLKNRLTAEEILKYNFDTIIQRLRDKLVLVYLIVGDKTSALKNSNFGLKKFFIWILPSKIWKFTLGFVRRIKHRSLLQKINL